MHFAQACRLTKRSCGTQFIIYNNRTTSQRVFLSTLWLFVCFFCCLFAAIKEKYSDWTEFLIHDLTGSRTAPANLLEGVSAERRRTLKQRCATSGCDHPQDEKIEEGFTQRAYLISLQIFRFFWVFYLKTESRKMTGNEKRERGSDGERHATKVRELRGYWASWWAVLTHRALWWRVRREYWYDAHVSIIK